MTAKYFVLFIYFLALFGIGVFAAGKVKNIKDYYVGGKKLGFWVVAFSTRATGASAWVLLGLTGMGAIFGIYAYWVALGTLLGEIISWFFMAKPFKRLTDKYDSITIPDYLESRFKATTHWLRGIAATALSLFVMIYVSAQIDATGTAFETFLGWNYFLGAVFGFLIVVAYMSFGGFVAVAWSDVFQGTIMLIGLLIIPAYFFFTEDIAEIAPSLRSIDPALLNIWGSEGFTAESISKIIGFLMIGLGYLGSPQLFVRYMSIKDTAEIDIGKWVSVTLTLFMNVSAVTIGILGRYYLTSPADDPVMVLGNGGQSVLILLVEVLMPNIISGLYIAAILAAIMSTIDSLLVLASSAISRDFYQKIFHPDLQDSQLSLFSKKVTLALSFFALLLAMVVALISPNRTIFWFVIFGWSGIAATFCPVMILSLFWKSFNEKGAIASMISGFLCVPLFKFALPALPEYGIYFQNMAELFPSFITSIFLGIVVSKLTASK
ncbi:sodium/proline symporter [Catalinimonas alkaloidigena]|uniref:sodium/proline symporter n=1 Tax=Catalinimonas alkaloidigena TaxID=1075417 RepID=UPI002406FA15|nr:sodium/proline symporter [Catalinimonas alkaloidigena]MDF9795501.1 sodium/proline symporter [Catalinimonas alkaloidigena]